MRFNKFSIQFMYLNATYQLIKYMAVFIYYVRLKYRVKIPLSKNDIKSRLRKKKRCEKVFMLSIFYSLPIHKCKRLFRMKNILTQGLYFFFFNNAVFTRYLANINHVKTSECVLFGEKKHPFYNHPTVMDYILRVI